MRLTGAWREPYRAFRLAREGRAQALFTVETTFVVENRSLIAEFAARERLPLAGEFTAFGSDGLLLAYGADLSDLLRRAATHVDRILKGERPAGCQSSSQRSFGRGWDGLLRLAASIRQDACQPPSRSSDSARRPRAIRCIAPPSTSADCFERCSCATKSRSPISGNPHQLNRGESVHHCNGLSTSARCAPSVPPARRNARSLVRTHCSPVSCWL